MDPTVEQILLTKPRTQFDDGSLISFTIKVPSEKPIGEPVVIERVINIRPDPRFVITGHLRTLAETVGTGSKSPFDGISCNVFRFEPDALVLANIDAIFNLTDRRGREGSLTSQQMDGGRTYIEMYSQNRGFVDYMQWRDVSSMGYGYQSNYTYSGIRYQPYFGTDWRNFARCVRTGLSNGVDTAFGNGYMSYATEYDNIKRIIVECALATACLRVGGNFCLKIGDMYTRLSADVLWLLAHLFKRLTVIKPITCNWSSSERYLICDEFNGNIEWMERIQSSTDLVDSGILSLFGSDPQFTTQFVDWMMAHNMLNVNIQYTTLVRPLPKDERQLVSVYQVQKCNMLWNIPEPIEIDYPINLERSLAELDRISDWMQSSTDRTLLYSQVGIKYDPFVGLDLPTDNRIVMVKTSKWDIIDGADGLGVLRDGSLVGQYKHMQEYNGDEVHRIRNTYLMLESWYVFNFGRKPVQSRFYFEFTIDLDLLASPADYQGKRFMGLFPIDSLFGSRMTMFDKSFTTLPRGTSFLDLTPFPDPKFVLNRAMNLLHNSSKGSQLIVRFNSVPESLRSNTSDLYIKSDKEDNTIYILFVEKTAYSPEIRHRFETTGEFGKGGKGDFGKGGKGYFGKGGKGKGKGKG